MVWMRPDWNRKVRKFAGRYETPDHKLGWHTMKIKNNYDVSHIGAEKWIHIMCTNTLGGDNTFLGIVLIVVGCICALYSLLHALRHINEKYIIYRFRKPGSRPLEAAEEALSGTRADARKTHTKNKPSKTEGEDAALIDGTPSVPEKELTLFERRRRRCKQILLPFIGRICAFICSGFKTFEW